MDDNTNQWLHQTAFTIYWIFRWKILYCWPSMRNTSKEWNSCSSTKKELTNRVKHAWKARPFNWHKLFWFISRMINIFLLLLNSKNSTTENNFLGNHKGLLNCSLLARPFKQQSWITQDGTAFNKYWFLKNTPNYYRKLDRFIQDILSVYLSNG